MSMTERDVSIMKTISEAVGEELKKMREKQQSDIEELQQQVVKLSGEVEGLISLLGEQ